MYYKYFTYSDNGQMVKWKFALVDEIKKESLLHPIDFFATIQNYDKDGKKLNCPIYIDVDTDNYDNIQKIEKILTSRFGAKPDIYLSGSKGYHLIVPVLIEGEDCEQVVKNMVELVLGENVIYDKCVYKSRNMWRVNGTINSKSGNRKKLLGDKHYMYNKTWVKKIEDRARESLKDERKTFSLDEPRKSWREDLTPCLHSAIVERPEDGEWHYTLFLLARFFFICSTPIEEAYDILIEQPHYAEDKSYVEKTLKTTYKWAKIGEKFGTCNSVISKYCNRSLCRFGKNHEKM